MVISEISMSALWQSRVSACHKLTGGLDTRQKNYLAIGNAQMECRSLYSANTEGRRLNRRPEIRH